MLLCVVPDVFLRTLGEHTSRPACAVFIGVGRFRILGGGPRFRILGGQGGPNSQQAHYVVLTSMRRNGVASTSFRRHVPTRFLNKPVPNNYIFHLKI